MCHITRLTDEQKRTFNRMPEAYRAALERAIEEAPPGRESNRAMFDAWAARLDGVTRARRLHEITDDVIAEAVAGKFQPARTR